MKRTTTPKLAHYPTPVAAQMATSGQYRAKTVQSRKKLASKNACRGLAGRRGED